MLHTIRFLSSSCVEWWASQVAASFRTNSAAYIMSPIRRRRRQVWLTMEASQLSFFHGYLAYATHHSIPFVELRRMVGIPGCGEFQNKLCRIHYEPNSTATASGLAHNGGLATFFFSRLPSLCYTPFDSFRRAASNGGHPRLRRVSEQTLPHTL